MTFPFEASPAEIRRNPDISCIDGRGFGVRREDMKKLLLATRDKVFTMSTLKCLVSSTQLSKFRTS